MPPSLNIAEDAPSQNDTIVAIATPPGRGGIGIVRVSGPAALAVTRPMLRLSHALVPGRVRFGDVLEEGTGNVLDQVLVTYFAAPHSYTGEDVVELAMHGAPVVLETVVRQCVRRGSTVGARAARPGEFTERAWMSGRMDLTQAEAVRDLIDAETGYQASVAAQQLGGALSRRIAPLKQGLVELIALLEAGIDFAEDDIDVTAAEEIVRRLAEVQAPLLALKASWSHGRLIHHGLTLAIVGRPNAGKSSLFNRLVERERAIVTAQPGTTRDTVTEKISLGGIPLEIVDTAGLRTASDEAERMGIERSREAMAEAALVLVVLDAAEPLNQEEEELLAAIGVRPALVAVNKMDLRAGSHAALPPVLEEFAARRQVVGTSAVTGEGLEELKEKLLSLSSAERGHETGVLTNLRQYEAVAAACDLLAQAQSAVAQETPHEMLLLDAYAALRELDSLTGETVADDILNLIFSTFCIGK